MFTLGTLTLDEDPYISISYEYSQSSNGRIIGGTKKITLTGTIVATSTSSLIISSNEIKDWFAQSNNRYIDNITIGGQAYSFVVVDSVSIDSEDWVSSINYTIVLIAQIETSAILPSNVLGLEYNDSITSLDIAESITISADKSNTYVFVGALSNPPNNDPQLKTIEESVTWEMKISLSCRRTYSSSAIQNAYNVLNNILITTPDRAEFDDYKNWTIYLQNRSLDTNPTTGSLSFSCKVLLIPPTIVTQSLVNIQGSINHNYISNSHSATVNLKTTGLVPINWSSIINLPSYYMTNKISNAKTTMDILINYYKHINKFPSQDLVPIVASCAPNPQPCTVYTNNICYIPKSINTTKNMTDGIMTSTIEWSSDNNVCNNGLLVEIEKNIKTIDETIVEQSNMWIAQAIITNINCRKAIVESWTINVSSKLACIDPTVRNAALTQYQNIYNYYLALNFNNKTTFTEIKRTLQQNNNSCSINCDFVQKCLYPSYYVNN